MRILSARDVVSALTMPEVIECVGQALAEYSLGHAGVPERLPLAIHEQDATMLAMPAVAPRLGALGLKLVSVFPHNPGRGKATITGVYNLLDITTGEPLALLEAASLTALRTGAVTGLATRLLARPDATRAALIGTGVQARAALRALLAVRPLQEVRLYNRTPERAHALAADAATWPEAVGLRLTVAPTAAHALAGADIVVTATTASTPVLPPEAVVAGMHICAIGAFRPTMREIPSDVVARAGKVVVESRAGALAEAGDLLIPISEGCFAPERLHGELGEICAGQRPGRTGAAEITLFKSVGHAVMDVAVARAIYAEALRRGLGQEVDLGA